MGQVSFEVNGQPYQLSCDDGQEERLASLAHTIDEKIVEITASVGHLSQERLLLMASILLLDDAADEAAEGQKSAVQPASVDVETLLGAARRIEKVAAQLEIANA